MPTFADGNGKSPKEKENFYNDDITVTKSDKNSAYFSMRKRKIINKIKKYGRNYY